MTQEQADLLNKLFEIEERIGDLWEFHPDNPNRVDVETEFIELQREASSITSYLKEGNVDIEEERLPF
jgi:hypothetical protein